MRRWTKRSCCSPSPHSSFLRCSRGLGRSCSQGRSYSPGQSYNRNCTRTRTAEDNSRNSPEARHSRVPRSNRHHSWIVENSLAGCEGLPAGQTSAQPRHRKRICLTDRTSERRRPARRRVPPSGSYTAWLSYEGFLNRRSFWLLPDQKDRVIQVASASRQMTAVRNCFLTSRQGRLHISG